MQSLGTMAILPKVEDARKLARASMVMARSGVNPVEQKRQEEAAAEAAAQAQVKTFAWLVEGFIEQFARRRQRPGSLYQTQRMLNRVMPALGPKLLSDIKKSDITAVLDDIAAKRQNPRRGLTTRVDAEARTIQICLGTLFRWALAEDHMTVSPMTSIDQTRYGKPKSRDRTLDVEEIRALWAALDEIGWPYGPIGQLLLLTGARAGEVAGMKFEELREEGRWSLPGDRVKNGRPHVVFLSLQAQAIINALPQVVGSEFVFTTKGTGPVNGFGDAKKRVDALMRERLAQQGRTLEAWVWHDIRRSVVTLMHENGTLPHVIEAVINHVSGHKGGIAGVYNKAAYAAERQAAMDAWGRYIDGVIGRGTDNVVALRV
jgi:integrase